MNDPRRTDSSARVLLAAALRGFTISLLAVYLLWNAYWVGSFRVPPSLLTGLTGIPCPTTGGTRAILALSAGDWESSWKYHPMAVPITAMLGISFAVAIYHRLVHYRFALPRWIVPMWLGLLAIAWVAKLLTPPEYW